MDQQNSQQEIVLRLIKQIQKLDSQIAHYTEKHEVQTKRLKYIKKQNQQLKQKKVQTVQNSQQIQQQYELLKNQNKSLKVTFRIINQQQLKNIQNQLSQYDDGCTNSAPKQVVLKDTVINYQTEQIDLPKSGIFDQDIDSIKYFTNIKTLIMGQNSITDDGMNIICNNLYQIKKLFLNHNQITDIGIKNISALKSLKCLDLRCNKITDASLEEISKITSLYQLSISNNGLTDEGVKYLVNLKQLKYLDITSNKISEVGGLIFTNLKQLTNLYLSHNKVNNVCVEKYFDQLKELRVLDVRFNEIKTEQKQKLKSIKQQNSSLNLLQLFI